MTHRSVARGARALILASLAIALLLALAMRRPRTCADADVTLGVSALRISLPVFLAAEQRIFARHGLRVILRSYPTAQPMVDDVALGRIDAGGFAAWPIVLLASARAPEAIRVSHAVLEGALVTVYVSDGGASRAYVTDMQLVDLEKRLGDVVERVHRKAIVSFAYVARLEPQPTGGYLAHMKNGDRVEISRQSARRIRRRLGIG